VLGILSLLAIAGQNAGPLLGAQAIALRATLIGAAIVSTLALGVGVLLGVVGGGGPRLLDALLRLVVELSGALPSLLTAVFLLSVTPGWFSTLFALGLLRGLDIAWLLRSELIRIERAERGGIARNLGHTPLASFFRRRLPRAVQPALIGTSLTCAWLLTLDSAVSVAALGPRQGLSTLGALAVNASSAPQAVFAVMTGIVVSAALYVLIRALARTQSPPNSSVSPPVTQRSLRSAEASQE
jgi:ABC-type dipeptide/oligopeptide/nickel transport system permease subunit